MATINPASAVASAASTEPAFIRSARAARKLSQEPHPFERTAATLRPHSVAWEKNTAQLARTTRFYVPAVIFFFGWPFALKYAVDSWNGVHDAPVKKGRRS
ncbi:hypothetical protein CB0940_03492 [Cercospora beticola]|uniref:Uncharacterized protein n=1 Tax=Cercospora beticola TaxID=122368 RepID=A0A2G5I3S3_CERBT|nr:hypothetical protein CB0940_03492 [Cercospora beticola]PIA99465.1 hypothetical protein CB0940_03492 [Cercospora beticola]WPB00666.1 hypothetical protein RHO25_005286 [Cercospora beticola]CAK1361099.1 unnamed protein product [Cercospora beticola]